VLAVALPGCGGDDDGSGAEPGSQPGVTDQAQVTTEDTGPTTSESDVGGDKRAGTDGNDDGHGNGGGDEQSADPKPPSNAEYVRAADRICRSAQVAIARQSAKYRDVFEAYAKRKIKRQEYFRRGGELTERSGEIAQRAVVDLKELPSPTSRREAIEDYLQGAAQQAALLTQQGTALGEGRAKEVAKLNRRAARARAKTRSAARRVGFRVCGGGS